MGLVSDETETPEPENETPEPENGRRSPSESYVDAIEHLTKTPEQRRREINLGIVYLIGAGICLFVFARGEGGTSTFGLGGDTSFGVRGSRSRGWPRWCWPPSAARTSCAASAA